MVSSNSNLYHVSGWGKLSSASPGDTFTLRPGPQGAEGKGVYFSEEKPRFSAAEGSKGGVTGVVVIPCPESAKGWSRTKNSICRKHGRPRTWHTKGREITLRVCQVSGIFIFCEEVMAGE